MQGSIVLAALGSSAVVASIGPTDSIIGFAEKFGITAALLLYFVYRDYKNQQRMDRRESELVKRIQSLEQEQKEKLEAALSRSSDAVESCMNKQMASGLRRALKEAKDQQEETKKHYNHG